MLIINKVKKAKNEETYLTFLNTWESLKAGSVVKVKYKGSSRYHYYLVVGVKKAHSPKHDNFLFVNLKKGTTRTGVPTRGVALTKESFNTLFAHTVYNHSTPHHMSRYDTERSIDLQVDIFEEVDATISVDDPCGR